LYECDWVHAGQIERDALQQRCTAVARPAPGARATPRRRQTQYVALAAHALEAGRPGVIPAQEVERFIELLQRDRPRSGVPERTAYP
jgi:hypothetical protein